MNLFTYGSLMLPDVFHAVTGARKPSREARLFDHARFRLAGETYPAIIPLKGNCTDGKVYIGLNQDDIARLDAFEGEMYERVGKVIHRTDCPPECAQVYILKDAYRHYLTDQPWDFDVFRTRDQKAFMSSFQGFVRSNGM